MTRDVELCDKTASIRSLPSFVARIQDLKFFDDTWCGIVCQNCGRIYAGWKKLQVDAVCHSLLLGYRIYFEFFDDMCFGIVCQNCCDIIMCTVKQNCRYMHPVMLLYRENEFWFEFLMTHVCHGIVCGYGMSVCTLSQNCKCTQHILWTSCSGYCEGAIISNSPNKYDTIIAGVAHKVRNCGKALDRCGHGVCLRVLVWSKDNSPGFLEFRNTRKPVLKFHIYWLGTLHQNNKIS